MGVQTLGSGSFHGIGRTRRHPAGLILEERDYDPGHELPYHAHEQPFFSLVLRGTFHERHERGRRNCLPTSLVFYPEQEPHTEAFGEEGGRCFNIELGARWIDRVRAFGLRYESGSSEARGSRVNWLATRLYAWCKLGGNDTGADELVLEMLAEIGNCGREGQERVPPPWLDRVREALRARATERVGVADLAEEVGVHPVHLARVFRRHYHCTIGEFVRRIRIEMACVALAEGKEALSSIAFTTGFSDQAHLTRRFKELTGMPPGAYRRLVGSQGS